MLSCPKVNKAIFRANEEEAKANEGVLATERANLSTVISGGAGTGKTLLMIRKVAQEEPSSRVLVVSRLPRLVNIMKTAVDEKRGSDGIENDSFITYDELLQLLARRVIPDYDSEYKSFVRFDRIHFDCDSESGASFLKQFFCDYLNKREQKHLAENLVEALTLWHAIITIKSHATCVTTKSSLEQEDYLALPATFGLTEKQRNLCFDVFLKYEKWREDESLWDEADRSMYVLKWGPSVYRDKYFVSWAKRVNQRGESELLDEDGNPLFPFFFDLVCADEAQDFTEVDIAIFIRMGSLRSVFMNTDPAQSVELGVKMRAGTVNDVFYSQINKKGTGGVKHVLQAISLTTNHRTHAENLAIGKAVRRVLARSFKLPITDERALINGKLPKLLCLENLDEIADGDTFRGGNIVFITPEEKTHHIRNLFRELGIKNDVFGVREAKGLEFDSVAVVGFFSYFEERGSTNQWQNVLRWLSSTSGVTTTQPTGEVVSGVMLEDCDYTITHPEISDEAMMLYTALTRARNQRELRFHFHLLFCVKSLLTRLPDNDSLLN